jgi:hypothetical protein
MPDSVQPGPVKNILFIMVDQLRWDYLGCTGHPTLQTPTLINLPGGAFCLVGHMCNRRSLGRR